MRTVCLLVPAGVTEVRLLNVARRYGRPCTKSGYYELPSHAAKLADDVTEEMHSASGVYIIPNVVNPALLARAANRLRELPERGGSTSDTDVLARRWLLVDLDPCRPSGISSTAAELELAHARALKIRDWLGRRGWPSPVLACSGNGHHLLYRIDLPAEDEGLVEGCLAALAHTFSDESVKVDQAVFNPARISRLYGTPARKGDSTAERPHRLSAILEAPADVEVVPREQLEALASMAQDEGSSVSPTHSQSDDLSRWLAANGLEARGSHTDDKGRTIYPLETCPFNSAHSGGSAAVGVMPSGARFFKCHHNGCKGRGWADLAALLGGQRALVAPANEEGDGHPGREPVVICLGDLDPEAVRWLWYPYIPLRKVTLIDGDPMSGKTWFALWIASVITTGRPFSTEGVGQNVALGPTNVVYLTAEDGLADTILPRVMRTGGDPRRVHVVLGWRDPADVRRERVVPITLGDVELLDRALSRLGPVALVVIDPIQGFLGSGVDMHRANEVRPVMTGLSHLAERHDCAIVAIRHLTKASAARAHYRGLGSIDFTAVVRSELLLGQSPETKQRAVVHIKSNLAPLGPALGYDVGGNGLVWTGATNLTASDLLASDPETDGAFEEATAFLQDYLAAGPRPVEEVESTARALGISSTTLKRARRNLVEARRVNQAGAGRGEGCWMWALLSTSDDQVQEGQDRSGPLEASGMDESHDTSPSLSDFLEETHDH